jgi:transcriptional regulator with GAF, ATPase, and Fis domain
MAVDEGAFFREAALRLCGNLNLGDAIVDLLQYLREFMPVDRLILERYDAGLGVMRRIVNATPEGIKREEELTPLSEEARDWMKWMYRAGVPKPYFNNSPNKTTAVKELLASAGFQASAILGLPLGSGDNELGAVVLLTESGKYTDTHVALMSLLKAPFQIAMSNALQYGEIVKLKDALADDNKYLQRELNRISRESIVGVKFGLKDVMQEVQHIAPIDTPVLLLGETGVGKDLIAAAIHTASPRSDGPFVPVNCGAISESLLDSELFGHEKGAFTGATSQKIGRFERADTGTIFLDEVAELTPQAQVKLLRVLQNREIERVGGTQTISLDIRIIAATNRNLHGRVLSGDFREDLWFRLNVFPIAIPPLRERRIDIPALAHHFVSLKARELRLPEVPVIAEGALERLLEYDWPGNVRELANVVERALILSVGGKIDFGFLDVISINTAKPTVARMSVAGNDTDDLDAVISQHIESILAKTGGRIYGPGGAAELLGVNPNTLRSRMKKLGIKSGSGST